MTPPCTGCKNDLSVLAASICSSYLSIMLLCVPLGLLAYLLQWSAVLVFTFNFLALIPLALMLGEITGTCAALRVGCCGCPIHPLCVCVHVHIKSTIPHVTDSSHCAEDLALRFGDVVGGLCNATFGNVVELLLSLAALNKGLYSVVAMSLIGSILSNLLLVLGMGGMRTPSCNACLPYACKLLRTQ